MEKQGVKQGNHISFYGWLRIAYHYTHIYLQPGKYADLEVGPLLCIFVIKTHVAVFFFFFQYSDAVVVVCQTPLLGERANLIILV